MKLDEVMPILKALADSSRLMVLNSLLNKPHYVEELAERLGLAISTVSFHLKKLEAAGLVQKSKEQYYVVYKVNESIFNISLREFLSFQNIEKEVQDERISNYRKKVLDAFFNDGELIRIPSQRKKRLIVLEYFRKKFKPDVIYNENEVDGIISEAHQDYCSIRRHLIDEGMMKRKRQKYWLNKRYHS